MAEGTIFRVFESKDELVEAALDEAFAPGQLLVRLDEIDPGEPLPEKLLKLASVLQQRFRATFGLMRVMGEMDPPRHARSDQRRVEVDSARLAMVAFAQDDAGQLSVSPDMLVHMLRLLTFAGSSEQISDGQMLSPEQIVVTLLHGVLKKED